MALELVNGQAGNLPDKDMVVGILWNLDECARNLLGQIILEADHEPLHNLIDLAPCP